MNARALILTVAVGSLLLTGCRNRSRRHAPPPCPPAAMAIPPQNIPDGAPPLPAVPRGVAPDPDAELLLPQNPPPKSRSEYAPPPVDRGSAILGDPDVVVDPPKNDPAPAEAKKPITEASGIADFNAVKDGVSAGQRPEIAGLDWLQAKGYKTIIHIRRPGDDDTTDRRQVERREMKYIALEMSPTTLTQAWLDEFNRIVADTGSRPIFVYGGDSNAAGVVWYLHLRTAEFLTHDEARLRAARLGLKDEKSEMFQAAIKLLPTN
jgi:protein tyrosine phosphatase (PTP) superfamily phosphohydrolase (DUF442 family)